MIDPQTLALMNGGTLATPTNFIQPATRFYKVTGWGLWKKFHYLLDEDYGVMWESAPGIEKLVIKRAPYDYDKSSVPKFGALLGHYSYGYGEAASLFHDDGYEKKGEFKAGRFEYWIRTNGGPWQMDKSKWSRSDLDELYRHFLKLGGATGRYANTEWVSVRMWPPNWFKGF